MSLIALMGASILFWLVFSQKDTAYSGTIYDLENEICATKM
jgi:hypothetical protein